VTYLEVGRFCPYLSMPSRWIFDSNVWRGIASFVLTPWGANSGLSRRVNL
jgi:hypothetical protein